MKKTVIIILGLSSITAFGQDNRSKQALSDGNHVIARSLTTISDGIVISSPNLDLPSQDSKAYEIEYFACKGPYEKDRNMSGYAGTSGFGLDWDSKYGFDYTLVDKIAYKNPINVSRASEVCAAYERRLAPGSVKSAAFFKAKTLKEGVRRFGRPDYAQFALAGEIITSVTCTNP